MKKKQILGMILHGLELVPGPVGAIASGVDHVVHRDQDPTNDVEETADAIYEILEGVIVEAEHLRRQDFVNDAAILVLRDDIKGDIRRYQQRVRALKPSA